MIVIRFLHLIVLNIINMYYLYISNVYMYVYIEKVIFKTEEICSGKIRLYLSIHTNILPL